MATPSQLTVVIHSCDAYARYWSGCLGFVHQYLDTRRWPVRFLTETLRPELVPPGVTVVTTGHGTWATRLRRGLERLDTPFVLYLQEDAWLTGTVPAAYLDHLISVMVQQQLNALKLFAGCRHEVHLFSTDDVNNPLWYIVSHQPSLWRQTFLWSTLYPEQEAMAHELETNAMLHRYPDWATTCRCHDEFTSVAFPYEEVSRRGEWLPAGLRLLSKIPTLEEENTSRRMSDGYGLATLVIAVVTLVILIVALLWHVYYRRAQRYGGTLATTPSDWWDGNLFQSQQRTERAGAKR